MILILASVILLLLGGSAALFAMAQTRRDQATLAKRARAPHTGLAPAEPRPVQDHKNDRLTQAIRRLLVATGHPNTPPGRVVLAAVLFVILAALIVAWASWVGALVVLGAVIAVPIVIRSMQNRLRQRINTQLPQFLGYMLRAVTAGNSFDEALYAAAMESSEPIRGVFLRASRQIELGADLEPTLSDIAATYQLKALSVLALTATVNRQYGGSMRQIIATLIDTIRQREAASDELKALTGETRFSAYVVAAIPLAITVFFYFQNPAYYADMLTSTGGQIAAVIAVVLEVLGIAIIWRMMAALKAPAA